MSDEKKKFAAVENGYDPQEVEAYIAELEKKIDHQETAEVDYLDSFELVTRLQELEREVDGYREIETSLKKALEATHIATRKIQNVVEEESRKILFEANQNADVIVNEALNQSIVALNYIKKMRTDAKIFQKRFQVLVDEQNSFSHSVIWDEILAPIDKYNVVELHSMDDIIKMNEEESNK